MVLMDKMERKKKNKPHDQNRSKMVLMDKSEKQKYARPKQLLNQIGKWYKHTYIIDSSNSHIYD